MPPSAFHTIGRSAGRVRKPFRHRCPENFHCGDDNTRSEHHGIDPIKPLLRFAAAGLHELQIRHDAVSWPASGRLSERGARSAGFFGLLLTDAL
jgi:hypothetical protein